MKTSYRYIVIALCVNNYPLPPTPKKDKQTKTKQKNIVLKLLPMSWFTEKIL